MRNRNKGVAESRVYGTYLCNDSHLASLTTSPSLLSFTATLADGFLSVIARAVMAKPFHDDSTTAHERHILLVFSSQPPSFLQKSGA